MTTATDKKRRALYRVLHLARAADTSNENAEHIGEAERVIEALYGPEVGDAPANEPDPRRFRMYDQHDVLILSLFEASNHLDGRDLQRVRELCVGWTSIDKKGRSWTRLADNTPK